MGISQLAQLLESWLPESTLAWAAWPSGTTFLVDAQNILQSDVAERGNVLQQLAVAGYPVIVVFDGSTNNSVKLKRQVEACARRSVRAATSTPATSTSAGAAAAAASSTPSTHDTDQLHPSLNYAASLAWGRYMRALHLARGIAIEVVLPEDNAASSADAYINDWVYRHPDRECCILSDDTDLLFAAQMRAGKVEPVHVAPIRSLRIHDDQATTRSRTLRELLPTRASAITFDSICAAWILGKCGGAEAARRVLGRRFDKARVIRDIAESKWLGYIDEVSDMVRGFSRGMFAQHLLPMLCREHAEVVLQPRPEHWFRDMMRESDVRRRVVALKTFSSIRLTAEDGSVREGVVDVVRRCVAMDLARAGVDRFSGPESEHGVFVMLDGCTFHRLGVPDKLLNDAWYVLHDCGPGEFGRMHVQAAAARLGSAARLGTVAYPAGIPGQEAVQIADAQAVESKTVEERVHDLQRLLWLLNPHYRSYHDFEPRQDAFHRFCAASQWLRTIDCGSIRSPQYMGSSPVTGSSAFVPVACLRVLAEALELNDLEESERIGLVVLACRSAKVDVSTWFWNVTKFLPA